MRICSKWKCFLLNNCQHVVDSYLLVIIRSMIDSQLTMLKIDLLHRCAPVHFTNEEDPVENMVPFSLVIKMT
jgi:hypothetical protein